MECVPIDSQMICRLPLRTDLPKRNVARPSSAHVMDQASWPLSLWTRRAARKWPESQSILKSFNASRNPRLSSVLRRRSSARKAADSSCVGIFSDQRFQMGEELLVCKRAVSATCVGISHSLVECRQVLAFIYPSVLGVHLDHEVHY